MIDLKISTAIDRLVFMTDSADHVTGKSGLTLTITASKAAAAFGAITPTVTERGDGWYALALTGAHTDTLGDLALHITGTGADPSDLKFNVTANIFDDLATAANLATVAGYLDTEVAAILAAVNALNNLSASGVRTAIGLASANLDTQLALSAGTRNLESGLTADLALRLAAAGTAGKLTGPAAGVAGTVTVRDKSDVVNLVVATVDANAQRTAVTVTP